MILKWRSFYHSLRVILVSIIYITIIYIYTILSIIEWSIEIANLAVKHKDNGIVGIDIAGDELQPMDQQHIDAFKVVIKCN